MPILTLTSDFGIQNHSLASVKGRILSALPESNIIDISHSVTGFNLQQTVYIFKQAYRHFPLGTFHFILSDLYAHPNRQLLYAFENGHHIFCADNGFMTLLFDDQAVQLYKITEKIDPYNFITVTDTFISISALLSDGNKSGVEDISASNILIKRPAYAFYNNNMLEAQVIYVDHFGNVVLNITQHQFEEVRQDRAFKILFMRDEEINQICKHYNDVPEGEKLCLFNIAGHLEIAVNKGHAASLFGFQENDNRQLFYNTIKLFFE